MNLLRAIHFCQSTKKIGRKKVKIVYKQVKITHKLERIYKETPDKINASDIDS